MGIVHWRFQEEESTFRHHIFVLEDLEVEKKKLKVMRKKPENEIFASALLLLFLN